MLRLTLCFLPPCVRVLRRFVALRFFDETSSSESEPCGTRMQRQMSGGSWTARGTGRSTSGRGGHSAAHVEVLIVRVRVHADIVRGVALQLADPLLAHALLVRVIGARDVGRHRRPALRAPRLHPERRRRAPRLPVVAAALAAIWPLWVSPSCPWPRRPALTLWVLEHPRRYTRQRCCLDCRTPATVKCGPSARDDRRFHHGATTHSTRARQPSSSIN